MEKLSSKQLPSLLEKSQSLRTTLDAITKQNQWNQERLEEPRKALIQARIEFSKENQLESNSQILQQQIDQIKSEIQELHK